MLCGYHSYCGMEAVDWLTSLALLRTKYPDQVEARYLCAVDGHNNNNAAGVQWKTMDRLR